MQRFKNKMASITKRKNGDDISSDDASTAVEKEPFTLDRILMQIPKGSLVCIVGRVGTGKSTLLNGLIGETRRTRGTVCFGGSVAYGKSNHCLSLPRR